MVDLIPTIPAGMTVVLIISMMTPLLVRTAMPLVGKTRPAEPAGMGERIRVCS